MTLANFLPPFNAICNASSALCIFAGFLAIRKKNIILHRNLMVSAFLFSTIFLVGYLTRFYLTGIHRFQGEGFFRYLYLSILISHSFLAIINVPLVITTLILGFRNRIEKHRKLARWTLPIWFYVSVTGVLIYFMLYHLWGQT